MGGVMHLYEIHDFVDTPHPAWRRTLSAAHERAKESYQRDEASIMLIEYPHDQATFCGLFNGDRPVGKPLRRWKLTPRGGLREVTLDGEPLEGPVEPAPERTMVAPQPAEPPEQFWARLNTMKKK